MIMYFAKRLLFLQALLQLLLRFGASLDAITTGQHITDGPDGSEVLVSRRKTFALGFFSPGKSTNRYVGIRYNSAPGNTVVWVANRDSPINDTSGVLSIDVHGNLVLHDKHRSAPIWSTNLVSKSTNDTLVQLEDSGNLVLISDNGKGEVLWESFDHPTNTQLPNMKIGIDRKTDLNRVLTSWKSKDDPGTGNWSYKIHTNGSPQLFMYDGDVPRWRSGHWTGLGWSGVPTLEGNPLFNFSLVDNQNETTTAWGITARFQVILSTLVLNESGSIQRYLYQEGENKWTFLGLVPYSDSNGCDSYGECGAFGNCDFSISNESKCSCLPGFLKNASGRCVRKRGDSFLCRSGEGFAKVVGVKAPDTSVARINSSLSFGKCREVCLQNCSCLAYASVDVKQEGGCITWHGDLIDTRLFKTGGQNLYVRVDALELGDQVISSATRKKSEEFFANKRRLAIVVVAILVTSFIILLFARWLIKRKRKGSKRRLTFYNGVSASSPSFQDSTKLDETGRKSDVQFFDLSAIIAATDNFSPTKRLGQGGFGPVYKGELANGQEIAVKTLSRSSKQGTEEFKNEVKLIAKLQHRNLVRLFGCCIHKEEKMLIYEYMPNKSLDFFIFDEIRRKLIDWRQRFEIISGIARGVLYLHQDSRLKIIHRDLKASNVLLDAAMNPKISDFGLARMFGDDQNEANTRKVVGTYGYMSPEYAMEGLYSIKSDVFSYGVLTLEIISGKRNNYHHIGSPSLNLIGHVWDLWMEGKAIDIVDSLLGQEYPAQEVLRCIQIGLLCVQEQATDRPTMLEIVFMLGNEATVPSPKKPAFINRPTNSGQDSSGSKGTPASLNEMTITLPEGR